jgi:hypothetical protein
MASNAIPPPNLVRSGSSSLTATSFHGPQSGVGSFSATTNSTPGGTPPPPQLSQLDPRNGPPTIYTVSSPE